MLVMPSCDFPCHMVQVLDKSLTDPLLSPFICQKVLERFRGFGGVNSFDIHVFYSLNCMVDEWLSSVCR